MRMPSINSVSYEPNQVPEEFGAMSFFLKEELTRVAAVIRLLAAGHLDPIYAAPGKPRHGDIVYADGTLWNPGSGEGIYRFSSLAVWEFVG